MAISNIILSECRNWGSNISWKSGGKTSIFSKAPSLFKTGSHCIVKLDWNSQKSSRSASRVLDYRHGPEDLDRPVHNRHLVPVYFDIMFKKDHTYKN